MDFTTRISAAPVSPAPAASAPVGSAAEEREWITSGVQSTVGIQDTLDLITSTPPAEVLDAIDRAAERVEALQAQNRRLHFFMDEETKRVIIEVQDHQGTVLRTIPPSHALDIMSGAEVK
jgi:hypothetical protein